MRVIRNFFRHIRDGFRHLFRNGWMTLASIFTMALTLFMIGSLVVILTNVQKVTTKIEQTIQVRAYLDIAANEQDEAKTKAEIEKIPHVVNITYRTKDQELEDTIKYYGSEFELFQGDANPLRNVFVVDVDKTDNIQAVADAVSKLTYVSEANYGSLDAKNIISAVDAVRYVIAIIATIFTVIAVMLISNTIRLTIFARQTEIEIMRLVGATNGFIRAPFGVEGAFIGLIGAGVAFGALYGVYYWLQEAAGRMLGINNLVLLPTYPLFALIGGLLLIVGIALGMLGARRSTRKFLKI
ncbi:permease-like cell division protein FtsX [Aerococcaceae bacterium NML160702]|nr:permease-like cell division protein FtsX [Aerococcaceae bacterium NML160702]